MSTPSPIPMRQSQTRPPIDVSRLERILALYPLPQKDQDRLLSRARAQRSETEGSACEPAICDHQESVTAQGTTMSDDPSSPAPAYHSRRMHSMGEAARTPVPPIITSTATASHHPSVRPTPIPIGAGTSRVPLCQAIKAHRIAFSILALLVGLVVAAIAGWIVFMMRMTRLSSARKAEGKRGGVDGLMLVGDGGFVLLLLVLLALVLRQTLRIIPLLRPPLSHTTDMTSQSSSSSVLPQWILRPPPYAHATREGRTGDVEDAYIVAAGMDLPKYGDVRGSKLLLRSESMGGHDHDQGQGQDSHDEEERVEVVVLYQPRDTDRAIPAPTVGVPGPGAVSAPAPAQVAEVGSGGGDRRRRAEGLEVEVEAEADEVVSESVHQNAQGTGPAQRGALDRSS